MYPKAEKMTNPAKMLVQELMMAIVSVSLRGQGEIVKAPSCVCSRISLRGLLLQHVVVEGVVAGHGHE